MSTLTFGGFPDPPHPGRVGFSIDFPPRLLPLATLDTNDANLVLPHFAVYWELPKTDLAFTELLRLRSRYPSIAWLLHLVPKPSINTYCF